MTCKYCGAELTEDGLFCQKCGRKRDGAQKPDAASGLKISNNMKGNGLKISLPFQNASEAFSCGYDQSYAFENSSNHKSEACDPVSVFPQPNVGQQPAKGKKIKTWSIFLVSGVLAAAVVVVSVLLILNENGNTQRMPTEGFVQKDAVSLEPPAAETEAQTLSIQDAPELIGWWAYYKEEQNSPCMCRIELIDDGSARLGYYCIVGDGGYDYRGTWKLISKQNQTYVIELSVIGGIATELTPDDQIIYAQNEYCFEMTLSRYEDGLFVEQTGCDLPAIDCFEKYRIYSPEKESEFLDDFFNQEN